STTLRVDVRVIAATNRDLEAAVSERAFREDLYYRLNVFPIHSPPLREHKEDIPMLVNHFVRKFGARIGKRIDTVPEQVMEALQAYDWPGNVRELENVIERTVILSRGSRLDLGDWRPKAGVAPGASGFATLEENERMHILEALEQTDWQVGGEQGAAALLGIKRTTLLARMKRLEIRTER
ncbi:MAG: sigma-54-dependent Fis family transcriptional regulator, partial [bacterium]|nr:sigma-54-dependent Fis family transcriptional regulator [bacterium]